MKIIEVKTNYSGKNWDYDWVFVTDDKKEIVISKENVDIIIEDYLIRHRKNEFERGF